jgi:sodium/proline symporter
VVSASVVAHDLGLAGRFPDRQLRIARLSVVLVVVIAVLVAAYLPAQIFDRVLSSWIALGSAFGPLVFMRLAGRPVSAGAAVVGIITGYALAVALPLLMNSPGTLVERSLPFLLAWPVLLAAQAKNR